MYGRPSARPSTGSFTATAGSGAVLLDPDIGDDELRVRLLSTVSEAQLREDQLKTDAAEQGVGRREDVFVAKPAPRPRQQRTRAIEVAALRPQGTAPAVLRRRCRTCADAGTGRCVADVRRPSADGGRRRGASRRRRSTAGPRTSGSPRRSPGAPAGEIGRAHARRRPGTRNPTGCGDPAAGRSRGGRPRGRWHRALAGGSIEDSALRVERTEAAPDGAADLVADLYRRLPEAQTTGILLEVDDAASLPRPSSTCAMAAFWGTGWTASSDGQFFPAGGRGEPSTWSTPPPGPAADEIHDGRRQRTRPESSRRRGGTARTDCSAKASLLRGRRRPPMFAVAPPVAEPPGRTGPPSAELENACDDSNEPSGYPGGEKKL